MKAILLKSFGASDQLYIGEIEAPKLQPNQVLVKVKATALNRADILQREGKYPPPKGASEVLGLEMAGEIIELGRNVTNWKIGDRVCGLLAGGGYAELVAVNEKLILPIPEEMSYVQAAAIPEVFLTAYQALFWLGNLQKEETVLIHAGASGVGTAAIQLAKNYTNSIFVTATKPKHELCFSLGAQYCIDYKNQSFEEIIRDTTNGRGADVIIDFIAAPYFQSNLNSLNIDGRMVLLAFLGGMTVSKLNLGKLLQKRITIKGSTLRNRDLTYKQKLVQEFAYNVWLQFSENKIKPIIDSVFKWEKVQEAHQRMEANLNKGKIVLDLQNN